MISTSFSIHFKRNILVCFFLFYSLSAMNHTFLPKKPTLTLCDKIPHQTTDFSEEKTPLHFFIDGALAHLKKSFDLLQTPCLSSYESRNLYTIHLLMQNIIYNLSPRNPCYQKNSEEIKPRIDTYLTRIKELQTDYKDCFSFYKAFIPNYTLRRTPFDKYLYILVILADLLEKSI